MLIFRKPFLFDYNSRAFGSLWELQAPYIIGTSCKLAPAEELQDIIVKREKFAPTEGTTKKNI